MASTSLDLSQIRTDALSSGATFRTLIGLGSSDSPTYKGIVLATGTITSDTPALNITQTWNNNAVAFNALSINATDTASAAGSTLADFRIGNQEKFKVIAKGGSSVTRLELWSSYLGTPNLQWYAEAGSSSGFGGFVSCPGGFMESLTSSPGAFQYISSVASVNFRQWQISVAGNVIKLSQGARLEWYGADYRADTNTSDLVLRRDAANTLAQRNGTNQQRFNLYGTYSDGANYRRLYLDSTTAGAFKIGVEGAGSGASGNTLELNSSTTKLGNYANGPVTLDFNSGISLSCSLNASSLWALQFQDNQVRLAWVAGGAASQLRFSRHGGNRSMISWGGSDTNDIKNSTQNAGIYSPSPGIIEINSGTTGTLRDLSLRSLLPATGSVAVDTPILSATSTWDSNVSVTGASGTGTTATLTFSAMTNAFPVGSTIVVSSVNPSGYNGTFTVTASTTTSVSYANATTGAYVSGGNIKQLFTALKLNVTDTSSDTNSLLMDLQVGGVSKLKTYKDGQTYIAGTLDIAETTANAPFKYSLRISSLGNLYTHWIGQSIGNNANNYLLCFAGNNGRIGINSSTDFAFGIDSAGNDAGSLVLRYNTTGQLDLRGDNGFRCRNRANTTFSDIQAKNLYLYFLWTSPGTDYERLTLTSATYSGAAYQIIKSESGGTGAANINLVLSPKGTGAILAQLPDGTTTGGNARGTNAVDLQMVRSNAANVASGSTSFVAGENNKADSSYSIAMGQNCVASNIYAIAIGSQNSATNQWATSIGGSTNTASNAWSATLGGRFLVASGYMSCSVGGIDNYATGDYSFVGCGFNNQASGATSIAFGNRALADRRNQLAFGTGRFAASGDAQKVEFVLRIKTTDATATSLRLGDDTTRLTIPSGKVFAFVAKISGIKSDGSAVAFYTRKGCIKNVGGTTTLVGNIETIGTDIEDNTATDVAITADDTNDALQINVTGITGETWRWVAVVEGVEIGYGT